MGMKRMFLLAIICFLLEVLFLYASFSKMLDLGAFRNQLFNQAIPHWSVYVLIWLLPLAELTLALLLMVPRTRSWALLGSLFLMGVFTAYTLMVLSGAAGRRVPCSCGGILGDLPWKVHFFFNTAFLVLAWWGTRLDLKGRAPVVGIGIHSDSIKNIVSRQQGQPKT